MNNRLAQFIESNLDLIDEERWDKLFRICPITFVSELKKKLNEAGINIPNLSKPEKNVMAHRSVVQEIKKFLKDHGIEYLLNHNDKGSTGRTLKFVHLFNVPSNIERLLSDYLDEIGVEYEYINYHPQDRYSGHITDTLRIRLTSEV